MNQEQKKKLLAFFASEKVGVLSTVAGDRPESALVGFSETDGLEIVFATSIKSRKYENLRKNPHASFVIGWSKSTVQYEGVVRELSGAEAAQAKEAHIKKNPFTAKFLADDATHRLFRIRPTWIRYVDVAAPADSFEARLTA